RRRAASSRDKPQCVPIAPSTPPAWRPSYAPRCPAEAMQLIQISAWNDSGGGFTHRLFDGHPGLRVWPFELLLGRDDHPVDRFDEEWFRGRFRWPRLGDAIDTKDANTLFDLISDAELKSVLTNPASAKHRDFPLQLRIDEWRDEVARRWAECRNRTQAE